MSEQRARLEGIDWVATFPFVRLFGAPGRALMPTPMLLCFAAVLSVYLVGRALDGVWTAAGGGVLVAPLKMPGVAPQSEIDVYATLSAEDFRAWRSELSAAATQPDSPITRRGPFAALLNYEANALAGLLDAAINLRFAPTSGAAGPTVFGAVGAAVYGGAWLLTQRPLLAVLLVPLTFVILSFLGGAACRFTAIQFTRDENASISKLIGFAREKWLALLGCALWPLVLFLGAYLLLALGSLVWAIPGIGKLVVSLAFVLTFIGGFLLLVASVTLVLGGHLMMPTIAAEASDFFDAVQRGVGYVWSRPWHFAFYAVLMVVQCAIAYLVFRVLIMTLLKLTNMAVLTGASVFGLWAGAESPASRFVAIWSMPAWNELPWLPSAGGAPFWGDFASAPLSGFEYFCMFFIALWVFIPAAKVVAFALSLYFSAATHMYLVLRHDNDGVDFDEIYYEEMDDLFGLEGLESDAEEKPKGTALPVVSPPPGA